jgi:hypothetical protein
VISQYLSAALRKAHYEILPDDGSYYGEIPCVSRSLPLPVVDGDDLTIKAIA